MTATRMGPEAGLRRCSVPGWLAWPAAVAAQTIKVGAVVPLTGRYAAAGARSRSATSSPLTI